MRYVAPTVCYVTVETANGVGKNRPDAVKGEEERPDERSKDHIAPFITALQKNGPTLTLESNRGGARSVSPGFEKASGLYGERETISLRSWSTQQQHGKVGTR